MKRTTSIRRLLLLLLLLAAGGLLLLERHPLRYEASEERASGMPLTRRENADVLVLVDAEVVAATRRPAGHQGADFSYGWVNLAEQELGRFAVLGPGEIPNGALDGRRVVVVTRSAVRAAELWLPQIKLFVEDGGIVVIERPTSRWDYLTGVEVGPGPAREVTEIAGIRMSALRDLPTMPWHTERVPLELQRADIDVLAEAGGQPAVVRRDLGRGTVIVFGIDVGRQLTTLQQGSTAAGSWQVVDRYPGLLRPGLHTDDLVADSRLLTATVPFADVFERFVFTLIDQVAPLPRWWLFPDAAPGAYLATLDEDGMGDAAAWMPEAERTRNTVSSCFLTMNPALTPLGLDHFGPPGGSCTMGLSWQLGHGEQGLYRRHGLLGVQPLERGVPLAEQVEWFSELSGRPPRFSRTRDLAWEQRWAGPFAALAQAGIRFDSSYGPATGSRAVGYLFGTGLPFLVLDDKGLPLHGLRELPFLVGPQGPKLGQQTLSRLLQESAELHHEAVTLRVSPRQLAAAPDVETYLLWQQGLAEARRLGMWITDLAALDAFFEGRRQGTLSSTFDGSMLLVTAQAVVAGQTLTLPAQWSGRAAGPVTVDGQPATPRRLSGLGGDVLLLPLARGVHAVVIEYLEVP